MWNNESRIRLTGGIWFAAAAITVASSAAVGASLSSSAIFIALCAAPLSVALLIACGAPSPTPADLLHAVSTQRRERRS